MVEGVWSLPWFVDVMIIFSSWVMTIAAPYTIWVYGRKATERRFAVIKARETIAVGRSDYGSLRYKDGATWKEGDVDERWWTGAFACAVALLIVSIVLTIFLTVTHITYDDCHVTGWSEDRVFSGVVVQTDLPWVTLDSGLILNTSNLVGWEVECNR